jgi:hypothetical protein
MGLVGAWEKYDNAMMRDVQVDNQANVRTFSGREDSIANSFRNYRRTVLNRLGLQLDEKRARAAQPSEAVWTADDMQDFLTNFCTFEALVNTRASTVVARRDPLHPQHKKALSLLIPPSLVKALQICIASNHSEYFESISVGWACISL